MRAGRRAVLLGGTAALGACALPAPISDPFALGVASGDPKPDGGTIWTRLAPAPLDPDWGMPREDFDVAWEIARDERMADVVRRGAARAEAAWAHAVHVDLAGLEPARDYFYRFRWRGLASPTGRLRTAGQVDRLRFASAGCQHYEHGHFTAYRHIANALPDFAFHYGDYIYEGGTTANPNWPRRHAGGVCRTLADYRRRYAFYRLDPDLQAAHAAVPFVMSFDDHEVVDNWAGDFHRSDDPAALRARKAAAFRAWYEHMPIPASMCPRGDAIDAYRALAFGDLLDLAILDTRQYRTRQRCGDGIKARCDEVFDPNATLLGARQHDWLDARLGGSRARWTGIAQQVIAMRLDFGEKRRNLDSWDGYEALRARLHAALDRRPPGSTAILSGDAHRFYTGDVTRDEDPAPPILASEFLATSISSGGDVREQPGHTAALLRDNPHVKHFSDARGYIAHEVTRDRWLAVLRGVDYVSRARAPERDIARFALRWGVPGIVLARFFAHFTARRLAGRRSVAYAFGERGGNLPAATLPTEIERMDATPDDVRSLRRRRVFAWAVDAVVCFALAMAAGVVIWPLSLFFPPLLALLALVPLVYNTRLISGPHRGTWGQRLAGVELVPLAGGQASALQAAAHFVVFYLSVAFTWGLILAWSFFDPRKRLLHDVLTGLVARRRKAASAAP
jgi:alkaline phosphatase D